MMPLAAIDWHAFFFLLFALLACGFAVAVVATSNIVRMAFYLTLSLGSTAGLFFLAGAQFVGAMQFLIYVGGTLVLLIFGVMLTAQSHFISMKTAAGEWIVGGVLGAALLLLLVRAGLSVEDWRTPRHNRDEIAAADVENTGAIGLGLVGVRVDRLDRPTPLPNTYSGYLLPFVIVSMHLLVVLVGAGYLARTKRRAPAARMRGTALATRPAARKHSFLVAAGIWSGVAVNAVLAIVALGFTDLLGGFGDQFGSPVQRAAYELVQVTPNWLTWFLAGVFLANLILLMILWQWQRWAAIGLVIVPLVALLVVGTSPWGWERAGALTVLLLLPVVPLLVLLFKGGRSSPWASME